MYIMKLANIFRILSAGVLLAGLASCHNQEKIFPDYEGGITAYFAYQMPVRTIVLGESETFDTTLDNQHKCIIYGTMGGSYKGKDVIIAIDVDNALADNVYFPDGTPVKAMPEEYYTLSDNKLDYAGTHMGGVEVTLKDAFFEDPDAIKNTYVIPIVMTDIIKGADQIKTGTPVFENETPVRTNAALWNVQPMDYTLYGIKYVNPWHGSWLRRGEDVITGLDAGTVVRHEQYVENDEVVNLTTESLDAVIMPVTTHINKKVTNTVTSNYALHITNSTVQDANWKAQVWYELAEPMVSGKTYIFKCRAAATQAYGWCSVFLQSSDGSAQNYNHGMSFSTEWKDVEIEIKPDQDVYQRLTWCFGDVEITLMMDKVSLTLKGSDENLITNGDFEDQTTTGWSSYSGYEKVGPGEGGIITETVESTEAYSKTCDVKLTFDAEGKCVLSSATEGMTVTGEGKFVKDGEKLAWGNKDRDGLYLVYTVDFGEKKYAIKDTLVARSREIKLETYTPTYKE